MRIYESELPAKFRELLERVLEASSNAKIIRDYLLSNPGYAATLLEKEDVWKDPTELAVMPESGMTCLHVKEAKRRIAAAAISRSLRQIILNREKFFSDLSPGNRVLTAAGFPAVIHGKSAEGFWGYVHTCPRGKRRRASYLVYWDAEGNMVKKIMRLSESFSLIPQHC